MKNLIMPDYIMSYLKAMRRCDYYSNAAGIIAKVLLFVSYLKYNRLGIKLGFSINYKVFGYGLVIPHYGTIVVGEGNTIGNYCVLHTSTCITAGEKTIGDGFYLSTGAKVTHNINIQDNVSIGANSLVNKSIIESDIMIAGNPAKKIKDTTPWYIRDGGKYQERVKKCENLKAKYGVY